MIFHTKEELDNMSLEELEAYLTYLECVRAELEITQNHFRAVRDASRDLADTFYRIIHPAKQPTLFQRFINFVL
ncbi:hypothetical protein D3C87_1353830 [compost metagenome]